MDHGERKKAEITMNVRGLQLQVLAFCALGQYLHVDLTD